MPVLDRYLLREMTWPYVGGLVTFVVLITGHMLFLAIEVMVDRQVPLSGVLRYIAYQVPMAAVMALPVASLLASALAMNRLATDQEVTALRAGGISLARMVRPVALVGLLSTGVAVWLNGDLAPRCKAAADGLLRDIVLQQRALAFRPQRFVDTGRGLQLYAEAVDQASSTVTGVYAFLLQAEGTPLMYWAPRARFGATTLDAPACRAYLLSPAGNLTMLECDNMTLDLTRISAGSGSPAGGLTDQTLGELWRQSSREAAGRGAWLELHFRLALAAACLVFALLAAPVALRFGRGQSLVGVLATILVVFFYYIVMLWMRMLGNSGVLPPLVAAYGQDAVLTLLALIAIWKQR